MKKLTGKYGSLMLLFATVSAIGTPSPTLSAALVQPTSVQQTDTASAPQLGIAPLQEVIDAMTLEEKVYLLVGAGTSATDLEAAIIGQTRKLVPGAAGTTFPIERLGIPAIVFADGKTKHAQIAARSSANFFFHLIAIPAIMRVYAASYVKLRIGGKLPRRIKAVFI